MDKTLGAYGLVACRQALEDAGIRPEDVDGLFSCRDTGAGARGGPAADWGPTRPYFAPPYNSEYGLSLINAKWLISNMPGLTNVKFAPENVGHIADELGMAAQAVGDGRCNIALVVYGMNNFEGRYRHGGEHLSDYARGTGDNGQWAAPWNSLSGGLLNGPPLIQQYCARYGVTKEELLGPVILNEHRNGLMHSWGYYTLHGASDLTFEDYVSARPVSWPMNIWDCDRPTNACAAFLLTTAERARDLKQKPIYILNHNEGTGGSARSSVETLEEAEDARARVARMVYDGSGFRPEDVDIFNPYDGYSWFLPLSLEGFGWHEAKKGDAKDFFNGDISVNGPHPHCSGGGNLGTGRIRTAMYIDGIEQLRGTAGRRQVTVKAETAICGFAPSQSAGYLCLSNSSSY
jgi:acetyl-CoA acetyltransferase